MKKVLISIQPKWCELIASGKKTVEIRKTAPKIEGPFKCYIYCTHPKVWFRYSSFGRASDESLWLANGKVEMCDGFKYWHDGGDYTNLNGKVIGEFMCDEIVPIHVFEDGAIQNWNWYDLPRACVPYDDMASYIGAGKTGAGWQISGLKIYEKPKALSNFVVEGDCDCLQCKKCAWFEKGNGYNVEDDCLLAYENVMKKEPVKPLFRAPQSWCYVETK